MTADRDEAPAPSYVFDDGGRKAAGFARKSKHGDCVVRAIAIAAERPYLTVRKELNERAAGLTDVAEDRAWPDTYRPYLAELGWRWVPTMHIGSGCKVHLRAAELPAGRIIARTSKHLVAVIDGVLHDNHDSSRGGTRCVYGYWMRGRDVGLERKAGAS